MSTATSRFAARSATSWASLQRHLQAFARFAVERGETHIRTATALAWVATVARTRDARAARMRI